MLFHLIVSITKCIQWHVNSQAKCCQGKYITWHTCPVDNLEKKTIWFAVPVVPKGQSTDFKSPLVH